MDFSQIDVFKAIGTRMKWLNERQTVISQNVANSDTPGYRPSDLKELDFKSHLKRQPSLELAATNGSHFQPAPIGGRTSFDGKKHRDFETTPTGNSVVLEEQMIKSAENQSDYDTMSNLLRKQVGMVKLALSAK